jgi:hypothetical protein
MERFDEHIQAEARSRQNAYAVLNCYAKLLTGADIAQEGFEIVVMD